MTFNEGSSFDGSRVRKGGRGGMIAGGGIAAVVVTIAVTLLSGGKLDLGSVLGAATGGGSSEESMRNCTAAEANTDRECRLLGTVTTLDQYWATALPQQAGVEYTQPGVASFTGSTSTGCGSASSATGPFYCPSDQTVYVDVSFFDELRDRFGAQGGELTEEYVVAHEFGHHIEQLTGMMASADRSGTGPESDSVRIELAADCLAGMWAGNAAQTINPKTGQPYLTPITPEQLADAMSAAAAVGDDHIQKQATGQVSPEGFTHGTSAQRQRWFMTGYNGGTITTCNALQAAAL